MRLTVLGSAGSYPGPGRACSSYLLEAEGYRLVLDCGNGSLANLQQVCDVRDIDQLVLSHQHHDHLADAYGLSIALRFHPDGPSRLDVLAADGVAEQLRALGSGSSVDDVFALRTVVDGAGWEAGPFRLSFRRTAHPPPTLAIRVEHEGKVVVYSADTGPSDAVTELAAGADLFLCEATWAGDAARQKGLHCTGYQAGEMAARAGARRLVVTHVAHPPTRSRWRVRRQRPSARRWWPRPTWRRTTSEAAASSPAHAPGASREPQ